MRTQFDSDHHQNRRLSSHSYSHESVIFCIFWINISLNACGYATAAVENKLRVSPLYNDRDSRLCTVASATRLRDAESIIFNSIGDAASRRGLSRVGYVVPLNGPLNGHPHSNY